MTEAASSIHPTALVDPAATLATDVQVGAYSIIGADVQIDSGTVIGPHCTIEGPTRIGRGNRIHGHAAIGGDPQDKKYAGGASMLEIGHDNVIREFVTIHRGTEGGGGVTRIGSGNWLLAYVHIAHDCRVGDQCVFSNNATLAGHVHIADHVILAGFAGIHQFCRIGAHAFIGMGAFVNGDVPPFVTVAQDGYGRPRGINAEGLKRRGFAAERIARIRRAYRTVYMSGERLEDALHALRTQAGDDADIAAMLAFIDQGERPLLR